MLQARRACLLWWELWICPRPDGGDVRPYPLGWGGLEKVESSFSSLGGTRRLHSSRRGSHWLLLLLWSDYDGKQRVLLYVAEKHSQVCCY